MHICLLANAHALALFVTLSQEANVDPKVLKRRERPPTTRRGNISNCRATADVQQPLVLYPGISDESGLNLPHELSRQKVAKRNNAERKKVVYSARSSAKMPL
jgi:hypothetical protein